ncbi:transporter substrate-binding domain-containing protein [Paraburkholderia sp. Ac-20340]|uniref:transporter substrate-binding domain-containing protein n=1 Tax=Paraburkholderia sp. Ac-20340 TaxID=2703888 RepID=UPI001F1204A5|nr:transporter substrate-binding domain-containing protein [Paraburkholderia sp. Ac-20340]
MTAFKTRLSRTSLAMLGFACIVGHACAQTPATSAAGEANVCTTAAAVLAPGGTLRASINIGNPVLAAIDANSGEPAGVSVDLAAELAGRLHAKLQLVVANAAAASLDNVLNDHADIGFFAIDPRRGEAVRFTAPYVLIEGAYAVRGDSPIARNEDVDRPGVSVAVSKGSAYDLYLSRTLQHATIVRISPSAAVFDAFEKQHLDVLAGVKPQLVQYASLASGLHVLDGRFMVIRQAMGVPKSKGDAAAQCVAQFVEAMRDSGFVAAALERHHIDGASVARAGD